MFEGIFLNLMSEESVWMIHAAAESENPDGEYHMLRNAIEEVLSERKKLADTFGEKHIEISISNKRMYRHFPEVAEVFEEGSGKISSLNFWERSVYNAILINGRMIQSARVSLIFWAKCTPGITGLRSQFSCRNSQRILFRLGSIDSNIQFAVRRVLLPL